MTQLTFEMAFYIDYNNEETYKKFTEFLEKHHKLNEI
jgi:hypothetical protein